MSRSELINLAKVFAEKAKLDPALVCDLCHWESGDWNPWALRYEPAFFKQYVEPLQGLSTTEKHARSCSYGLMQIMGQVAREFGFSGAYLTQLCDPETNLLYGCKKLARSLDRYSDTPSALLHY